MAAEATKADPVVHVRSSDCDRSSTFITQHTPLGSAHNFRHNCEETRIATETQTIEGSTRPVRMSRTAELSAIPSRIRPHRACDDPGWAAIRSVESQRRRQLRLNDFTLLKPLGKGDTGTVFLAQLNHMRRCYFAVKIMNKDAVAQRNKGARCATELRILEDLDHPFLPTLYASFESNSHYYLVIDFCSGGDLHYVRQLQPNKRFSEDAARFYVAEVVVALEYLHMKGIIYRDLKPENVLIRHDGHIVLTDFDLAMIGHTQPKLETWQSAGTRREHPATNTPSSSSSSSSSTSPCKPSDSFTEPRFRNTPATAPALLPPDRRSKNPVMSCIPPLLGSLSGRRLRCGKTQRHSIYVVAEPAASRSMSFVGTFEYLAPEIIRNEGHGSAVDWWTLGIFLYELLYGATPFGDPDRNSASIMDNVINKPLRFPDQQKPELSGAPMATAVSAEAKDLIKRLLVKDPSARLGSLRGSADVKRHPFFRGLQWHLLRNCKWLRPPLVPAPSCLSGSSSAPAASGTCPGSPVTASPTVEGHAPTYSRSYSGSHAFEHYY